MPIHEMVCRRHLERIAGDMGPAVGRRTQADDLRPQLNRPIISVMRDMMEGDGDRQTWTLSRLDDLLRTVAR